MILEELKRLTNAFEHSVDGLKSCYRNEASFRLETIMFIIAIPIAIYFGKTRTDIILLIGSGAMVLVVELLNSAVENTANRIGLEFHPMIKDAKDQGSAAVLITSLLTVFTWVYILLL